MKNRTLLTSVALAAALLAGACSSASGDDPTVAQAGAESTTTTAAPAAADADGATTTTSAPASPSGGRLTPGRWEGPVTGGFQGDKIAFTVSEDGSRITDIVMSGNWRCTDGTKFIDVGHFPGEYTVGPDGSFGGEQREPYLLWTMTGRPDGPGAGGSVRIEYDTECDTYKLDWTARPQ